MRLTAALVGCGRVASLLEDDPLRAKPATHLGALAGMSEEIELIALCDLDREKLENCGRRWQVNNLFLDYREMIRKTSPDLLIIASWTDSHHPIALFASENGVRGLLIEKPLALNLRQAREIVNTCRRNKTRTVINHERRWDPLYRETRKMIDQAFPGRLLSVSASVFSNSFARGPWSQVLAGHGGGPLFHDGTHLVDMIRYLAGEIAWVSGRVAVTDKSAGSETWAWGWLETVSGIPVFLEAGGDHDFFHFEIDLQFSQGRLRIGNGIRDCFVSRESNRYQGFQDLVPTPFPPLSENIKPFPGALAELCRAVREDREASSSALDGLKALEIIFALYRSAARRGKPVKLPFYIRRHPLSRLMAAIDSKRSRTGSG